MPQNDRMLTSLQGSCEVQFTLDMPWSANLQKAKKLQPFRPQAFCKCQAEACCVECNTFGRQAHRGDVSALIGGMLYSYVEDQFQQ